MEVVTDDTLFPHGEFRFTRMSKVPANVLLKLTGKTSNIPRPFKKYIKDNLESIKKRAEENANETNSLICNKFIYINKKLANIALSKISKEEQEHKKPIRSYECPFCSGWHLTSMPLDVFLDNNKTK